MRPVFSPELIAALDKIELEFPSPMKCRVVSTEIEFDAVVAEMDAAGLRLAAVSNAGLSAPQRRLTFLPQSAFTDGAERT